MKVVFFRWHPAFRDKKIKLPDWCVVTDFCSKSVAPEIEVSLAQIEELLKLGVNVMLHHNPRSEGYEVFIDDGRFGQR
jgi:hypothetical protein